ncbi:hypothetical protein HG537_0E04210 [Torulaspora globosa]|uniref:Amino acid transporter transmembrane domain-containing protein n=1 Tax=Torulaspora globosa TaxID=48254 RepID=A0A7H9HVX7_9SACH|nr:hypothetical protein HG537_0E04210 [Torulaspora sp. CBS 2947]
MSGDYERQPLQDGDSSQPQVHYISIPIKRTTEYGTEDLSAPAGGFTTRRQSILDQPIGSFRGVNSLSRFATSLRRANSFRHIDVHPEIQRNYFEDANDEIYDPDTMAPAHNGRKLSIALNRAGNISVRPSITNLDGRRPNATYQDIDDYGAISDSNSVVRADGSLAESISGMSYSDLVPPDAESIMIKRIEGKDGAVVTVLAGQSTAPQTIFNSINVLIGIGLFALPLGLKHAGWVLGSALLLILACGTFCTAELLSRCLDTDPTIMSYADLGYAAFGRRGRALISCLFTLDLLGSGVSLIILFGDSLNALFPSHSSNFFKVVGLFAVTPAIFIPLNILSNISFLGIMSTIGTVFLIIFCGFYKKEAPGSLLQPMETHLWPESFMGFCLSIGLLSACWGGHAVFPNLKTDMRHPEKFKNCLKTTYKITSVADIGTAVVGFLMYGNMVHDEITKNILLTAGYPNFVYGALSALMAVIPVAKTPLNARPIVSVLDTLMEIDNAERKFEGNRLNFAKFQRIFNRIFVNVLFVGIAIVFPKFDKLIAFLGAGLCFAICLILPCLFYIKICKNTIKPWEQLLCYIVIGLSAILAILGVGAAFLV